MDAIVESTSWFCFNDMVTQKINTLQNYSIYPYLQYAFVAWHFDFASMKYPQIAYPSKQYEVSQKCLSTKQIFDSLKKGLIAPLLGLRNGSVLLLDMVSLLKIIICPEIRSVSMHLLSQKEKNELQHTVEVIADFGITLVQLLSNDGTYVYRADPDIDHFSFEGIPTKQISYWSKQLIAQQVEVEKMRRLQPKVAAEENAKPKEVEKKSEENKNTSPTSNNKMLPNHLQKLIPIKVVNTGKSTPLVCRDFFGRVVSKSAVKSSSFQSSSTATPSTISSEIDNENNVESSNTNNDRGE